ncbi:MAG TPA: galactokinase, partial [Candidatus Solibacter sp.]
MIITRTPLRISLGGGGTDLPSYYREHGGFVLSAAIDKYVYITVHETFRPEYLIKYSMTEVVETIDQIKHPIIREALRMVPVAARHLEIVSMSDIPAGTGLGSSGSFTIALLRALHTLNKDFVPRQILAEQACRIEIDLLGEPVGKQDQYIASFGGITSFEFRQDGSVDVTPLSLSSETLYNLEDNLLLFFTGFTRSASAILAEQDEKTRGGDTGMIDHLHQIKQFGYESKEAIEQGDLRRFAAIMHEHWERK